MAGRGGAGNIEAANRRVSRDLEASQSIAESASEPSPIEQALQSERKERTVAHTGRGGGGNTYNPSELAKSGEYSDVRRASGATVVDDALVVEGEPGTRMRGRGGAGNYDPDVGFLPGRPNGPAIDQGGIKPFGTLLQAEQDVEKGLARPNAAYLGAREREKDAPSNDARPEPLTAEI